jgi:hypothetical protein
MKEKEGIKDILSLIPSFSFIPNSSNRKKGKATNGFTPNFMP